LSTHFYYALSPLGVHVRSTRDKRWAFAHPYLSQFKSTKYTINAIISQAFIHVSTAYCNCDRNDVAEEIYPVGREPDQVIALTEWMDDKMFEEFTPNLIGSRPNTYTFTKALAEQMLQRERGSLPVAIVRPSIVLSSYKEPVAGWVDNCNGPTGIIAAVGKGFFRWWRLAIINNCYINIIIELE